MLFKANRREKEAVKQRFEVLWDFRSLEGQSRGRTGCRSDWCSIQAEYTHTHGLPAGALM